MQSFPLAPDSEGYAAPADDCLLLWPTGECPNRLWLGVQGILRGAPWGPADPPPPFDVFPIDYDPPCHWHSIHDGITFDAAVGLHRLHVGVSILGVVSFFSGWSDALEPCWFANLQQNPAADKYYGGFVIVMSNVPDNGRSAQELCELTTIPKTSEYYSNPRPMPGNFAVHSIMSIAQGDFIRIKVEHA